LLLWGLFQSLPEAALVGATIIMFGSVAASGINILSSTQLDRRALLINCGIIGRWFWHIAGA